VCVWRKKRDRQTDRKKERKTERKTYDIIYRSYVCVCVEKKETDR
jgi:hypothetical protein